MTNKEFKKIQKALTLVAIIAGGLSVFFALEIYSLHTANDLTQFGYAVMPLVVLSGFAVTALVVVAKLLAYSRR